MTEAKTHQVRFTVSRRARQRIAHFLILSIGLLATLGTIFDFAGLAFGFNTGLGFIRLFGLGQEANVPTWFSSAMLLIAALLAAVVALVKYQSRDRFFRQWSLLSVLLCLMSLDETAVMHEVFPLLVAQRIFNTNERPWFIDYAWVPAGIVIFFLMVWWFWGLWQSLGAEFRQRFTWAALIYFGGALGFEVAEATFAASVGLEAARTSAVYFALWTTQEILEMAGAALFILALLDYLSIGQITIAMQPLTDGAGGIGRLQSGVDGGDAADDGLAGVAAAATATATATRHHR